MKRLAVAATTMRRHAMNGADAVRDLANDVRRHLRDEPIFARPGIDPCLLHAELAGQLFVLAVVVKPECVASERSSKAT